MKRLSIIIISVAFFACNSATTENETADTTAVVDTLSKTDTPVPYTEAKNFFVKNTFKADSAATFKITTQHDFNAIFGIAKTMSAESNPSSIDFSTQYVAGIIEPASDTSITLAVKSLTQNNNDIILNYTKTTGEKQSFTSRPFLLLVVDNKYTGNFTVQQQ